MDKHPHQMKCIKCEETKLSTDFEKKKDRPSGRGSCCKACKARKSREYHHANKEKQRARFSKWRKENPQKKRDLAALYRINNPEKARAWCNKHYANNREYYLEKARRRREEIKLRSFDYGWESGGGARGLMRDAWFATNPGEAMWEILADLNEDEVAACQEFLDNGQMIPDSILQSIRIKLQGDAE